MRLLSRSQMVFGGRRSATCLVVVTLAALVSVGCGTRVEDSLENTPGSFQQQAAAVDGRVPAPGEVEQSLGVTGTTVAASGSPVAGQAPQRGVPIAPGSATATAPRPDLPQSNSGAGRPAGSGGVQSADPKRAEPRDPGRAQPENPIPARPGDPAGVRPEVVIGSVGTLSGPAGATIGQVATGVQVWARFINKRGGVRGHRVRLITQDDGGDPARHRGIIQDLVDNRHVIAFVGNPEALTGQPSVDYLTGKGIPVIGSDTNGGWFYGSPVYFPQAPHGESLMEAMLDGYAAQTVPKGLKRVAIVTCVEASACTDGDRIWTRDAAKAGYEVVYKARVSLAQPDFTAECLNAQRSNAQVIATAFDSASVARFARSCLRQGYRPVIGIGSINTAPFLTKEPGLQKAVVGGIPTYPWFLTDTPAIQEFRQAVAEGGLEPLAGYELGWASGKLFEALVPDVPGEITPSAVLARRGVVQNETLGGLTMPLTFEAGKNAQPRTCGYLVAIQDEHYVSPDGGRLHCRS